jgi:hypothetical protein
MSGRFLEVASFQFCRLACSHVIGRSFMDEVSQGLKLEQRQSGFANWLGLRDLKQRT